MKDGINVESMNWEKVCKRLWEVEGPLRGLGSLFEQQAFEPCYQQEELYGIGQLLKGFSGELAELQDVLRNFYLQDSS